MLLTYEEHARMWRSPAALEALILQRAVVARRAQHVREMDELWTLYRRYCQRPQAVRRTVRA